MSNLPFVLGVSWVKQNIVTCLQMPQNLDTLIIRVAGCPGQKNPELKVAREVCSSWRGKEKPVASYLYRLQHLSPCKPDTSSRLWLRRTVAIIWVLVMGKNKQFQCTYILGHFRIRKELIWVWAGICSGKGIWMKYTAKFILVKSEVRQRSNFWAQPRKVRKDWKSPQTQKSNSEGGGTGPPRGTHSVWPVKSMEKYKPLSKTEISFSKIELS